MWMDEYFNKSIKAYPNLNGLTYDLTIVFSKIYCFVETPIEFVGKIRIENEDRG